MLGPDAIGGTAMSIKTTWNGLSRNQKLAVGGGAFILLALAAASTGHSPRANGGGGQGYGGYAGPAQGGGPTQGGGDAPQGYGGGYAQGPAYQAPAYGGGGQVAYGGGAPAADGANTDQYWATQRSNEQRAEAFSQTIRETNTVRDSDGNVYEGVPNQVADPAIETGNYTQVPTNELPTTTPAPADSPPPQE